MAKYKTDFSEYATSAQPADWSEPWDTAGAFAVVDDAGAIGGKFLRKTTGSTHDLLRWDDVPTTSTDMEFVARMRLPSAKTDKHCVAYLRAGGTGASGATGIGFVFDVDNMEVATLANGNYAVLATLARAFSLDTWYWMRGRVHGTTCSIKVWGGKFSDEPTAWDIQHTAASLPASSGGAGLNSYATYSMEADFFSVGTGTDTADGPTGPADSYDVEYQVLGAVVSGPHVVAAPTVEHAIPSTIAVPAEVTARVRATNAGGSSDWDTQTFTLRGRLSAGAIESPAEGATVSMSGTFAGTAATDAEA